MSGWYSPNPWRTAVLPSTSLLPMNQESMPGPVAIASPTCSTEAGTSMVSSNVKSLPMSVLLCARDARVHGDDHPVRPASCRALVVVLRYERRDRVTEFGGERRAVGRGGE